MTQGLEGVVAASTRLSHVDGEAGQLILAGYALEDLAPHATFEEVAYLFLHGRLPEPAELVAFTRDLAARRALPRVALEVLREAAAATAPVIDATHGNGSSQPRPQGRSSRRFDDRDCVVPDDCWILLAASQR